MIGYYLVSGIAGLDENKLHYFPYTIGGKRRLKFNNITSFLTEEVPHQIKTYLEVEWIYDSKENVNLYYNFNIDSGKWEDITDEFILKMI